MNQLTKLEIEAVGQIIDATERKNKDNISRTEAYFDFFKKNPEIRWAFLASMVSRNGGWNMCDLEGAIFSQVLEPELRRQLFLTYERANWLIFHDAFPQLLIYEYSKKINKPMFHLFPYLKVSCFMEKEWGRFWREHNRARLTTSLIINEQNVIQVPVLEHPVYRNRVFRSMLFSFQDWLHFSCVLFPTCGGEVYGASVNGFRTLSKRIDLGKRLAKILFHPRLFLHFFEFAEKTVHTGSRYDYEHYFKIKSERKTPMLRTVFPIIDHQQHQYQDWSRKKASASKWLYKEAKHRHPIHLTDWYLEKSSQLELMLSLYKTLNLSKWK